MGHADCDRMSASGSDCDRMSASAWVVGQTVTGTGKTTCKYM